MKDGIQTRVYGPTTAKEDLGSSGFVLPVESVRKLIELFGEKLVQKSGGPVQMLVDAPDMPPSVVNVSRYYGKAAVVHVLRAPPEGDVPALAGIYVLLPGADADADEAAIAALENSRDKTGLVLPLSPQVYASLRADVRPLLAMLFFTEDAVKDVSLRLLGVTVGEAFFASLNAPKPPQEKPPAS